MVRFLHQQGDTNGKIHNYREILMVRYLTLILMVRYLTLTRRY